MKKIVLFALAALVTGFQFCSSSKKTTAEVTKTSYARHVQPIMQANCSPCHIPPQGKAKPLNSFATASAEIDDILDRIKRDPSAKGFMPAKHPKLPDSTIAVFEKWKATGLAE